MNIKFKLLSISFLGLDTPILNETFHGFILAFQEKKGYYPELGNDHFFHRIVKRRNISNM
jgi:hypothetical protein